MGVAELGRLATAAAGVGTRDAGREAARRVTARVPPVREDAIAAGIAWLERTHDATGRQGSSKGYSLLKGWFPAYPETTGYVLETLLWQAERTGGDEGLVRRALEMADWEVDIQEPDGGIMEGHAETRPRRSIVFNTGMVLHGWVTLLERGHDKYAEAAARAARFLVEKMSPDGTWDPAVEFSGIAHTYNSRVAWAMARYGQVAGDDASREAAARQLNWVVAQQRPNGWFDNCFFKPGMVPSTHGLAYTLRGLVESSAILGEDAWLQAALRTSEPLVARLEADDWIEGAFDADWQPTGTYMCLTGTVQLGGVWLRLGALTGDERLRKAGLGAVELAARFQERLPLSEIDGALAGSFPVWGKYAPAQYPNWATRFLVESLMLRDDALRGA